MNHTPFAAALLALALPASAQGDTSRSSSEALAQEEAPSPNAIVESSPQSEWMMIPPEDLLVMELTPDAAGGPRSVIIQLMPAPFSQGWVENIRTLARAEWYDGISINRVQDNYVVQWGDPNYDNPEGEGEAKPLPEGLRVMDEDDYATHGLTVYDWRSLSEIKVSARADQTFASPPGPPAVSGPPKRDDYLMIPGFGRGWPIARINQIQAAFPVHCYGMVGVGRGYSPDTGSGAELYTVIGHAPRHLDRNIALVGRVISGIEHMSSLPRGSGALGFYTEEEAHKRAPIVSVRVVSDLPEDQRPAFEYLSTDSETFAKYAAARANRRDQFFIVPAGGADICNIPVPVRPVSAGE